MAEAFVRKYADDRFEAYSAGMDPTEINPFTVQVMDEGGIPLDGQYAKDVELYLGQLHFGYLITVCSDADRNCPTTFPGIGLRLHWGLEDPAKFDGTGEEKIAKFRQVRDQIDERVKLWLNQVELQDAMLSN